MKTRQRKDRFCALVGLLPVEVDTFSRSDLSKTEAQALTCVTKKYGNLVMCYIDGEVIMTPTLTDHFEKIDETIDCMKRIGLKCKPLKCETLRDSIEYF